jgi:type VI secretion system protein VasD
MAAETASLQPGNDRGMVRRAPGATLIRFAVSFLNVALCVACGAAAATNSNVASPSCRVPNDVQLEIEASDRVNLDETGRSLPTRLRLYQLTDLTQLQRASFEDVWSRPKEVLAGSALSSEELVVYPGQVLVHRFKRNERAEYLVGVAVFREPEAEAWRTAEEWPLPGDPCQVSGRDRVPRLAKLRVRMFLDGNRLESLNNYARLPKRRCRTGRDDCAGESAGQHAAELRRNRRLQSFEENAREPEIATPAQ